MSNELLLKLLKKITLKKQEINVIELTMDPSGDEYECLATLHAELGSLELKLACAEKDIIIEHYKSLITNELLPDYYNLEIEKDSILEGVPNKVYSDEEELKEII